MSDNEAANQVVDRAKLKSDLIKLMRHHQQEYAALSAQLKEINLVEEQESFEKKQLSKIQEYREKYNFYVSLKDGSTKSINWDEVERLVTSSFSVSGGYMLGFDESGMPGLGNLNNNSFEPMVEEETDGRKVYERELRRKEYADKKKLVNKG